MDPQALSKSQAAETDVWMETVIGQPEASTAAEVNAEGSSGDVSRASYLLQWSERTIKQYLGNGINRPW